jgi:pimeloyl-ACP methyl ester carboxylesterase
MAVIVPVAPVHEPPPIPGVRRSRIKARGVDFHVTEAGDPDGLPVLLLHGWPQHHYAWRQLLSDPPTGLRLIAPDLPGYGWSGAPPHRWFKEEIVSDLLALLDALALDRVVLVGHDWGGYIGHLMVLRAPERFHTYLALNILHPWNTPRMLAPHVWRFLAYQPALAIFGYPLMRYTNLVAKVIGGAFVDRSAISRAEIVWFSERFRDPVCARAGTDSYRTFWTKELPHSARNPERRRSTVPTLALFGVVDPAIHHSLAAAETANADDYRCELVYACGHFIAEERPALVRRRLEDLAARFT